MTHYIDKDALVAEIEKNKNEMEPERDWHFDEYTNGYLDALKEVLSIINTLEVKEVDLEKDIKDYIYEIPHAKTGIPGGWKYSWDEEKVIEIAKHFYELGLQKGE